MFTLWITKLTVAGFLRTMNFFHSSVFSLNSLM